MQTDYEWGLQEVIDAVNALDHDATNLKVIHDGIKSDPEKFITELLAAIVVELERLAEKEKFCPECFVPLDRQVRRECVGYYGSAKAYENYVYYHCPECGEEW